VEPASPGFVLAPAEPGPAASAPVSAPAAPGQGQASMHTCMRGPRELSELGL
jgi:hypothetical protein